MCIGLSFKDLAYSIITNIIQPIISIIISMLDRNNVFQLQELISNQHNALNFSNFSSSFLTFIFVIIISYYASKYLTIVV
jgi:large-conductance mechanosensitive channel